MTADVTPVQLRWEHGCFLLRLMIAILSDIHANLVAMEAVLADAAKFPVTHYFCLGDIIGYGPDPVGCLDLVRELEMVCVHGNHEAWLRRLPMEEEFPAGREEMIQFPLQLAFDELSATQRNWLEKIPLQRTVQSMEFVHGSLFQPEEFYYIDCAEEAERHFSCQQSSVRFHGHTHVPGIWREEANTVGGYEMPETPFLLDLPGRYAINVGSVGQPRDADPRASYMLYDSTKSILHLRRVEYAISHAQKRFAEAGLPEFNSTRLKTGC